MYTTLIFIDFLFISYFIVVNFFYLLLFITSIPATIKRTRIVKNEHLVHSLSSKTLPPISIIFPVYNEEQGVLDTTQSALTLSYRSTQVIVINDGSTDKTLLKLKRAYNLYEVPPVARVFVKTQPVKGYYRSKKHPNLLVIDKENGGRDDSLNAGLNACVTPFSLNTDGDVILAKDCLQNLVRPLLTYQNIVAIGAAVRPLQGNVLGRGEIKQTRLPKGFIPTMQVIEYLRGFLFGRIGWNYLGGLYLISGAAGLFDTKLLRKVGGYLPRPSGDFEMTVKLHAHLLESGEKYRIEYVPDVIVWTDVPESWKSLWLQRERWYRNIVDVFWRYKYITLDPLYKRFGFIQFIYVLFVEIFAPIAEFLGYIYFIVTGIMGTLNVSFLILFLVLTWGFTLLLSLFSLIMEQLTFQKFSGVKDIAKLVLFSLIENLGYRQFTFLARIWGFFRFLFGKKYSFEEVKREWHK